MRRRTPSRAAVESAPWRRCASNARLRAGTPHVRASRFLLSRRTPRLARAACAFVAPTERRDA
ncbi:hypothetical protein D0U02_31145 [Burkholderia pseudomallei]|uniref:Uncharacterized protein n=2 Tax=Burkholderia pseudomallei TaxID=28450 RepID=A0AAX0TZT3_BURPE|nr:conserved hypothetical protein [Burkholderia pseudomallei 1106a]ARK51643.1 hypothetical protein BOC35_29985 [Burkholderia pseudomallei]EDU11895.1 hypothetical protein BURPS1655_H0157 [Burkholderia pseudomallei 1655]EES25149.1 conserved hypothetical protein [Burkholderia pseudomallei 1106b]ARK55382.1 hypothetical protein BOC36_06720 [Burkholderia pseudomallei]